jgi:adenylate cyclase
MVPIRIYEPLGREEDIDDGLASEIELYQEALQLYRGQEFGQAKGIFEDLQARNACPLYELYLQRINAFLLQPPESGWDGVFIATSK